MSSIIDKVMGTDLMREMVKDLTVEERDNLSDWVKLNIGPLDSLSQVMKDLGSTDSSAESFADAINYLFSTDGTKEFEEWLEKSSETS